MASFAAKLDPALLPDDVRRKLGWLLLDYLRVCSIGALPELMVWDREGCLHAGGGRPTEAYAGWCGQLPVDWYFC